MKARIIDFLKRYKIVFYVIASFLICCALTIDLNETKELKNSFNRDVNLFVILFICFFFLYYKISFLNSKLEKRGKIVSAILSVIYSLIDVIGYTYNSYKQSIFTSNYCIKIAIRFIGFYLVSNKIIQLSFYALKNKLYKADDKIYSEDEKDKHSLFSKIKKYKVVLAFRNRYRNSRIFRIFIIALLIILCYLPYYLQYYPGSACFDGQWQMAYVDEIIELSNHHPVFHTIFIAFFMNLSHRLGGGNNLAIALYCFTQMVVNAIVFSIVIEYLRKLKIPKRLRIAILLILALVPIFPLYAITLWKDTGFALAFLIFTIFLSEIHLNGERFFTKKKNVVLFIISAIFVALLRNNGIYAIAIAFPFLVYSFRKQMKYIIASFGIVFIFCFGWNIYIHEGLGALHTETKEMLSVPSQAFARVYKYNYEELTDDEKNGIEKFIELSGDEIKTEYNPINSDPIRFKMSDTVVDENLGEIIKLYFHLLKVYPKTVIDAFLDGCYGYFYPNILYWRTSIGIDSTTLKDSDFYFYDKLDIHQDSLIDSKFIKTLAYYSNSGDRIPFIYFFFSIGLWFEILLFLFGYNIFNHQGKKNFVFIPLILLIMTCYLSPIFGEFRYVYAMFTSMPALIGLSLIDDKKTVGYGEKKDEDKMEKENNTKIKKPFSERMKDFYNNNKDTIYNFTITVLAMFLFFYVFVGCKTYINSESAFVVDYAQEQIRTKQLFPTNWVYGNDFWIFSLVPFITPLLLLGMKVFVARQIAVVIQSVLLILLVLRLFKKDIDYKDGGSIILPLLLSGVSGMFAFEVFGDALYGSLIFFMLILLTLFLKMLNNNSKHLSILFGLIFAFLSACNFGFSLFMGVPLLCVLCCIAFKNREAIKEYVKIGAVILVSALIGFCGHKVLETTLIYKTEFYDNSIIEDDNSISQTMSTLVHDYLSLCGSADVNTKGLSIFGYNTDSVFSMPIVLLIAVRYVFAIITLLIPILLLRYLKIMNTSERTICLFTIFLAISVFLFYTFGNVSSWARFAVPVVFFMLLLYPIAYKYMFSKDNKRIIAFKCFVIAFALSSLFFVSISIFDNSYLNVKIANGHEFASENEETKIEEFEEVKNLKSDIRLRKNPYMEIVGYLTKQRYSFGYTAFSLEHNIYNTISNGKLRAIPLNSKMTGPGEWHNSLDWYDTDFYNGKVFLIRKKDQKKLEVEKSATKIITYGDYKISFYNSNEEFLSYLEDLKEEVKK